MHQFIDSVARFHLRNGACFFGINFLGNEHTEGLTQSAGLMVNYMYSSSEPALVRAERDWAAVTVDDRALAFESSGGHIPCSEQIKSLLLGEF